MNSVFLDPAPPSPRNMTGGNLLGNHDDDDDNDDDEGMVQEQKRRHALKGAWSSSYSIGNIDGDKNIV